VLKSLSIRLINAYQERGGSKHFFAIECNFEPTCSEYTKQCIGKFGAIKGWRLGLKRIGRCCDPNCLHKISDPIP